MSATHRNNLVTTISNTPGGAGALTISTAQSGCRTFASGDNGLYFDVRITDGTDWEVRTGCVYTHSGTSLARGTLEDSSTGSAITLTSAAIVTVTATAGFGNLLEAAMQGMTPGGRLTLTSGVPVTTATNAVAVSGQDTSADTITVTASGWAVGTVVTSSATSGGITAGTTYYAGNITTNTISLHTTVAAALAGTSKLDITGAVTATITAQGVANTSIYYCPYVHNIVNLWDGLEWLPTTFTEKTLALGTLTSALPYDVFGYLSSGQLVLEALAWTNDTTRATAVTLQDGRYCKSGDKTRLLLGTFYTTSTTTTEDSNTQRLLANLYNRVGKNIYLFPLTAHTYATATARPWNNDTALRIKMVSTVGDAPAQVALRINMYPSTVGNFARNGIGLDSTTVIGYASGVVTAWNTASTTAFANDIVPAAALTPGFHYLQIMENADSGATANFTNVTFTGLLQC